ncbi:response regulator [Laspinema olomoucense]|uniref:Response regulator n=1 Tax=Laspinema olomoucense D3b TaxID=2953688 RepID=A0ABT2NAW0_9CYAN|nr:response regulator [Laspinema sp. D3b]MCT7979839.1 response regulator [Laspinema sp. D3b]
MMTFEEALEFIESTLESKGLKQLNTSEKEILKAAWENEGYSSIADSLYLSVGHIKDVAALLWKRLSEVYHQKITKNNFRYFMDNRAIKAANIFQNNCQEPTRHNDLSTVNILIVQPRESTQESLAERLTERGYRISTTLAGDMALATARHTQPDLILIDIKMPELGGYEVYKAMQTAEDAAEIPVIFLSVTAETFNRIKDLKLGWVDYINKPFNLEELIVRIDNQITIQQKKHLLEQQIQQHKEIAEILYQSRALLASLLNSSFDGIAAMQSVRNPTTAEIQDFRCLVVNLSMAKILGEKRDDLTGARAKKVLAKLVPGLFDSLVQVVETGQLLEQKFLYEINGEHKWYYLKAVKVGDGFSTILREVAEI